MDKKRDSFFLGSKKKGDTTANGGKKELNQNGDQKLENDIKKKRQDNFNKNRKLDEGEVQEKKPFDKKTYRLKKYSKKYKLEQWEEQRKKIMLHKYQKEMKNDPMAGTYKPVSFDEDTTDSVGLFVRHPDIIEKEQAEKALKEPFSKAKEQFNKVKQDKLQKQQEKERAIEEKNKKLLEYKKKKQDRFKKLSKKTKKGQPVMTGRLELLLEKIQNNK